MNFLPLFEIRVDHAYYTSGRCPDLSVEPTGEGARVARNHRLVVKQREGGVLILTPVGTDQTPRIPFSGAASMAFQLRQRNHKLALFTDLLPIAGMTAPYYTNEGLAGQGGGRLSLAADEQQPPGRDILARVEIAGIDRMTPSATPPVFEVALAARAARWIYYVVTNVEQGEFAVVDSDPTPGATPLQFDADNNPRDLVSQPDPSDAVAVDLAAQYPAMRRLRFVSSERVPSRQEPRKYLELHIDGMQRASALPNPSFESYAKVDMTIDNASQSEPSFFRLIKHIAQPFSTI